jgi:transcriptional regulator with XRE-family HTH domain
MFRVNRGMSQTMLAERIGVTFNRFRNTSGAQPVGASRLSQIASVLGVSVGELFRSPGLDLRPEFAGSLARRAGALRVLKAYARTTSPRVRLCIAKLVEASPVELRAKATVPFNTVDRGERRKFLAKIVFRRKTSGNRVPPVPEASAVRRSRPLRRPAPGMIRRSSHGASLRYARTLPRPNRGPDQECPCDLLAVEPAAAMRVARLADEMDIAVVLQQHVTRPGKCTGKLDRPGNWRTSRNVLVDCDSDSETSTPTRLWIGAITCGATSEGSVIGPAVAIERYSPSGPQRQAISHSRLRLQIKVDRHNLTGQYLLPWL